MNEVQRFMQQAVDDQIKTAGELVTIKASTRQNVSLSVYAVITSRDGSYTAAVGGSEYGVTGHALLRKSDETKTIEAGYTLEQLTGEKWLIVNVISSSNDAGVSCDLIRKQ